MPSDGIVDAAVDQDLSSLRKDRRRLADAVVNLEKALLAAARGREQAWREGVASELSRVAATLEQAVRVAGPADDLHNEISETEGELRDDVLQLQREIDYLPRWLEWFRSWVEKTSFDSLGVRVVRDEAMRLVAAIKRMQASEADLAYVAFGSDLNEDREAVS